MKKRIVAQTGGDVPKEWPNCWCLSKKRDQFFWKRYSRADKNELISTEFDVDIKITDIGTPQTIWEDDNSIISFIVNEVMIDGVLTIEKLIGSGTAIKAHVVEYVIIDDKVDGGIDTKVAAFGLAKNAKTLKELNP